MKIKFGLILATMLSTGVMAQVVTNAPTADATVAAPVMPLTPPDATTNAVPKVKKTAKKKTAKKVAAKKKSEDKAAAPATRETAPAAPLVPNEPAVAKQNNVNIRGQAHINSEVIGHLKKGDTVTVLEAVTLKHPATDEPANWVRIALPATMHVWVNTAFIDATNQTVSARKLNLRTGAGENYSVIGLLHKGDAVKPVKTKGDWTEIEAPTNAFAFVAAHLLSHKEPEPVVPQPVVQPTPPVAAIVENPAPIAAPASGTPEASTPTPAPAPPVAPLPIPAPAPVVEEPLPPRIVEREGIVGGTVSIQAPSHFELQSLDNGRVMDYLYTTSTNLTLKRYKGLTVLVTGEEELDERWPNTPVITIQKIQVVK